MAKPLLHAARVVVTLDAIPSTATMYAERCGAESVWIPRSRCLEEFWC